MKRALSIGMLVVAMLSASCSSGSKAGKSAGRSTSTSTATSVPSSTAVGATTSPGAPPPTAFAPPTLPRSAPAGAAAFEVFGVAGAVEPASGMLGVVLGPLPNGFILVEAKSAAVTGVAAALVALKPGTPVHVVGYSENVNGIRLVTAVTVDSGPQAVPH